MLQKLCMSIIKCYSNEMQSIRYSEITAESCIILQHYIITIYYLHPLSNIDKLVYT